MRAKVYWIPGRWPGRLAIVPRPRGGEWLEDEMASLREAGLDALVSLLEPAEAADLGLEKEAHAAAAAGFTFRSFPIADRGVPSSREQMLRLAADLVDALKDGKNVAIHCRQGIGRSAVVAAGVLISSGEDSATAVNAVSAARGTAVPETDEQQQWIDDFATSLPDMLAAQPRATSDHLDTD